VDAVIFGGGVFVASTIDAWTGYVCQRRVEGSAVHAVIGSGGMAVPADRGVNL